MDATEYGPRTLVWGFSGMQLISSVTWTHSLRYFCLAVSEPGPEVHEFTSWVCELTSYHTTYDSVTRQKEPRAPWMAESLGPDQWDRYTQLLRSWQQTFKMELSQLQKHLQALRAHGFYPPEISMTWMKNGEEIVQQVDYGGVLPSADGTYQMWVSVDPDSQSKDVYSCHVEHCGLQMVLEAPGVKSENILPVVSVISRTITLTIQKEVIYHPTPVSDCSFPS
ncbi:Mr1 [Phodopus roborovskii]|uniref:Mr1 protein n=1 Tax=Phodopus roborovskii TaxID=109678 RepID=A0AAU9ZB85_PHORO|nr:Mr1 [Phodopus roborovskii]